MLQHGSLLLRRSPAAPELPGLEDLAGQPIPAQAVAQSWLEKLGRQLAAGWAPGSLSPQEQQQAAELVRNRYAAQDWTERWDTGLQNTLGRFTHPTQIPVKKT